MYQMHQESKKYEKVFKYCFILLPYNSWEYSNIPLFIIVMHYEVQNHLNL